MLFVLAGGTVYSQSKSEDFTSFTYSFFSDTLFQKERTIFPLMNLKFDPVKDDYDTSFVTTKDWVYSNYHFLDQMFHVQIYDNFKRTLRNTNERVVSFEGVENGIGLSLFFTNKHKKWFLLKIIEEGD
jgi:hypothetical protein